MSQSLLDQMNLQQRGSSAPRVGFGPRFGAILIDIVLTLIMAALLAPLAAKIGAETINANNFANNLSAEEREAAEALGGLFGAVVGVGIGFILASFLYNMIEAFTGASLGKRTLGLTIAYDSGQQGDINLWLKRWAIKNCATILSMITFILRIDALDSLISILSIIILLTALMMLGQERQALYDKLSKTAVYYKRDLV